MEFLPFLGGANLLIGAFVVIMQLRLEMRLKEELHALETRVSILESQTS